VGWAEKGSTQTVFALNLDIHEPRHIATRMKLAQLLLADVGAIATLAGPPPFSEGAKGK